MFAARTVQDVASLVGGVVDGEPSQSIHTVAGLEQAGPGALSFLANPKYFPLLATTGATAVLVAPHVASAPCTLIRVENPDLALARVLEAWGPQRTRPVSGVHPSAVIAEGVQMGRDVAIGPCVVVEAGAALGDGVVLWAGVFVGAAVAVGAGTELLPNVTVHERCVLGQRVLVQAGAVIGSDGFGFVWDGTQHVKVPQVGHVVLEDDVEIGANTVVDRARFGATVIRQGAKLDNLIQIAHNVDVGPHCAFASQVGISGSSRVEGGTQLGGQVGVAGHLTVGPGAVVSGQAGVTKNLPGGERYTGFPARPHALQVEEWRHLKALGRLRQRVRELERRLEKLEA